MFISSCSSLCTGKGIAPHPTEEIGMDHFLGFEVGKRLAGGGGGGADVNTIGPVEHFCHD